MNRGEEVCLRFHLLPERYGRREAAWVRRKLTGYWQGCLENGKRRSRAAHRSGLPLSDAGELWVERELARRIGWQQPELTEEVILWTVRKFGKRPGGLICLDEQATEERLRFQREKLGAAVWLLHGRLNHLLIVTGLPELYGGLLQRVYEDSGLVGCCTPSFTGLPAGWNRRETMVLDLTGGTEWSGCRLQPRNFLDTMMKSRYNTLIVSRPGEAVQYARAPADE